MLTRQLALFAARAARRFLNDLGDLAAVVLAGLCARRRFAHIFGPDFSGRRARRACRLHNPRQAIDQHALGSRIGGEVARAIWARALERGPGRALRRRRRRARSTRGCARWRRITRRGRGCAGADHTDLPTRARLVLITDDATGGPTLENRRRLGTTACQKHQRKQARRHSPRGNAMPCRLRVRGPRGLPIAQTKNQVPTAENRTQDGHVSVPSIIVSTRPPTHTAGPSMRTMSSAS